MAEERDYEELISPEDREMIEELINDLEPPLWRVILVRVTWIVSGLIAGVGVGYLIFA